MSDISMYYDEIQLFQPNGTSGTIENFVAHAGKKSNLLCYLINVPRGWRHPNFNGQKLNVLRHSVQVAKIGGFCEMVLRCLFVNKFVKDITYNYARSSALDNHTSSAIRKCLLLHDVDEIWTGDIPSLIKTPEQRRLGHYIFEKIMERELELISNPLSVDLFFKIKDFADAFAAMKEAAEISQNMLIYRLSKASQEKFKCLFGQYEDNEIIYEYINQFYYNEIAGFENSESWEPGKASDQLLYAIALYDS